jgi:hypothetical protein
MSGPDWAFSRCFAIFALTGGWTVILNNNNVTYEYNRKMMYDFYLANN